MDHVASGILKAVQQRADCFTVDYNGLLRSGRKSLSGRQ